MKRHVLGEFNKCTGAWQLDPEQLEAGFQMIFLPLLLGDGGDSRDGQDDRDREISCTCKLLGLLVKYDSRGQRLPRAGVMYTLCEPMRMELSVYAQAACETEADALRIRANLIQEKLLAGFPFARLQAVFSAAPHLFTRSGTVLAELAQQAANQSPVRVFAQLNDLKADNMMLSRTGQLCLIDLDDAVLRAELSGEHRTSVVDAMRRILVAAREKPSCKACQQPLNSQEIELGTGLCFSHL